MKVVLVTGGFDPLHSGHIAYFKAARELGNRLVVGVNSDAWLTRKKGRPFMPLEERAGVIQALSMVDAVIAFDETYDADNSAIKFIEDTLLNYPEVQVVFANGGDRTQENIPEMSITNSRLSFEFGVGGKDKSNSSSWILEEWKAPKTDRQWGYYRVLHEVEGCKVKELTVDPGKTLSMQRHGERAEHWMVSEGVATVEYARSPSWKTTITKTLNKHDTLDIDKHCWHQLRNETDKPLRIIEIQYGTSCKEEDIERK